MKALVPINDGTLTQFLNGLAEYGNQDSQVSLAQQVLYGLGIATAENMPAIEDGESLPEYIKRLSPTQLATIEGLGIGQGQQLQEYFKIATRLIIYQQYVTGRWQEYARELGVEDWSPYVTHLLDDCLRISSESEGRRWAVAIEVIAQLYHPSARERLELTYIGDPVIDHETGEVVGDETQGLPTTPEEAIRDSFNRYAREAGVKLRDLLRETNTLSPAEEPFKEKAQEIRRILNLATDSGLDDRAVNRQATGGRSLMPAWVLPEDTPPAWASYLSTQFPDVVSDTGSLGMGQRYVQVRLIVWPKCPECGKSMWVGVIQSFCNSCDSTEIDGRYHRSIWSTRIADEHGRYPEEWTEGDKPTIWIAGIAPETMDIHGLKVSVWEVVVKLEDLDG